MQSETIISRQIRKAAGSLHMRLWRNDTGQTRARSGQIITYGFGKGSSDLIGYKKIKITSDMVGQDIAQFVALEVKCPGKEKTASPEQIQFIDNVLDDGGISGIITGVDDLMSM
jgi:hypothetical protein